MSVQAFAVSLICVASLFIAAAFGLSRSGLWALSMPFAGFALWKIWKCSYIPRRERIVATREGNDLVVTYTSGVSHPIRLDLSGLRYAWVERQLRGGPTRWMIQFGSTPDESEVVLDLGLLRIHPGEKQRSIYNAFLQKFIGSAFEHIEALTVSRQHSLLDASNSYKRRRHDDGQPRPIHGNSAHPVSKSYSDSLHHTNH